MESAALDSVEGLEHSKVVLSLEVVMELKQSAELAAWLSERGLEPSKFVAVEVGLRQSAS